MKRILGFLSIITVTSILALGCGGDGEEDPGDEGKNQAPTKSQGPRTGSDPGSGFDNVAACKSWVATIKCGSFDASSTVSCDQFTQATTCDVSPYFDCLTDNFKCTEMAGQQMPDASAWAQCTHLARCQ